MITLAYYLLFIVYPFFRLTDISLHHYLIQTARVWITLYPSYL